MNRVSKIGFIDKVVMSLDIYCPQMSVEVKYFVACQFALESNFGQSRLARTAFNFSGMKIPIARVSLNRSVSGVFARYNSFDECVIDYCYWLASCDFNVIQLFNLDLFSRKLIAKRYSEESDYIDRVFSLYNSLNV